MSEGESRVGLTVRVPAELNSEIEDDLDYGESKAEWIRQACRERLREAATQN